MPSDSSSPPTPFNFTENSKAMYDAVLEAPPFFIRWVVRGKVDAAMRARGCGTVTEDLMYDVCKEVTPANQLDRTIEVLDKHKTTAK